MVTNTHKLPVCLFCSFGYVSVPIWSMCWSTFLFAEIVKVMWRANNWKKSRLFNNGMWMLVWRVVKTKLENCCVKIFLFTFTRTRNSESESAQLENDLNGFLNRFVCNSSYLDLIACFDTLKLRLRPDSKMLLHFSYFEMNPIFQN